MDKKRAVTWRVLPSGGLDTAWIDLRKSELVARGRAVGTSPVPYWVRYELETDADYVTRFLRVTVEGLERTGELELRNDSGRWEANGEPLSSLDGAVDCDLGLCPLTNTMPILRHRVHADPGRHEFLMAWVAVPELAVKPSRQIYTHLRRDERGAHVRYESGTFTSDLIVDEDGLVVEYPQLATRIAG